MMKRPIVILALAASAVLVSSCKFFGVNDEAALNFAWGEAVDASEQIETRTLPVAPFDAVDFGMACRVEYLPGNNSLEVKTHENLFRLLNFEVDDTGVLKFTQDNYNVRNLDTMVIRVHAPSLRNVNIGGAAQFSAMEGIEAETFKLNLSGAGDVEIKGLDAASVDMNLAGAAKIRLDGLDSQELSITINGAGDVVVSGRTDHADARIRGAGKIDLKGLEVDELTTSVSGAGTILEPER
ncbi:MAG TPA: DUF2807 domain-containing protein [Candidatus Cryptobacteroides excrementigallinarum]|nr:DUF2807 domain-containing protein [Candidatus Cryptobacteroides excrementigallinarum]